MTCTVLFIDAFAEEGGAEVAMRTYLRNRTADNIRPVVLFLSPGPFAEQIRSLGISVYVIPRHRRRQWLKVLLAIIRIARIARREGVDVIHTNGLGPHLYAALVATLIRRPTVWQIYDPPRSSSLGQSMLNWLYLRLPASYYAFSADSTRERCLELNNSIRSRKWTTLYPASDRIRCNKQPRDGTEHIRARLEVPSSATILLTLARLQATKGHDVLLHAVPIVCNEYPDVRFLIVGGSLFGLHADYGEQIRQMAHRLGLNDKVIFTGFCDDDTVRSLLDSCEMLVHPALAEPFGLAITEAMATGKPVVATSVEGPSSLVVPGETGLLVPPGHPEALASAILWMLRHPVEARAMGERGAKRVAALYSVESLVSRQEAVYWQVTKPRSRSSG